MIAVQLIFDYHANRHSLRVLVGAQNWNMATDIRIECRYAWTTAVEVCLRRAVPDRTDREIYTLLQTTSKALVTCALGTIDMAYDQRMSLLKAHEVTRSMIVSITSDECGDYRAAGSSTDSAFLAL